MELAEAEGRRIMDEARLAGDAVRDGADDYALGILTTLEGEVEKALAGIRKGIGVLDDRRAELAGMEGGSAETDDEPAADDEPDDETDDRRPAYR
jgi:hypothetical protein